MKINNFKNELNSFLSSHLAKLIIEQKIETINLIKPKKINIALAFLMLPNVKLQSLSIIMQSRMKFKATLTPPSQLSDLKILNKNNF